MFPEPVILPLKTHDVIFVLLQKPIIPPILVLPIMSAFSNFKSRMSALSQSPNSPILNRSGLGRFIHRLLIVCPLPLKIPEKEEVLPPPIGSQPCEGLFSAIHCVMSMSASSEKCTSVFPTKFLTWFNWSALKMR